MLKHAHVWYVFIRSRQAIHLKKYSCKGNTSVYKSDKCNKKRCSEGSKQFDTQRKCSVFKNIHIMMSVCKNALLCICFPHNKFVMGTQIAVEIHEYFSQ